MPGSAMQTTVGIVAKPSNRRALELTRKLIAELSSKGIPFLLDESTAGGLGDAQQAAAGVVPREQLTAKANTIVVLGGDGTLISVSRHPADPPPVVIGVNAGRLGFLTEVTADEMLETVHAVLEGKARLETRFLLSATVTRGGKEVAQYTAVNDVVVTKEALARIFEVGLQVNDELATNIRGDGVIVSTPGGSTAYSLGAGGSIVHPQVEAILITPICPHSLTSRPLVIPGKSTVKLLVSPGVDSESNSVYLTIDGQTGMALRSGDEIRVTTSPHSVCFAKSPSKGYFEILGTKLKWAQN